MYLFIPAISQRAIMHWSFQSSNPNKQAFAPSFKNKGKIDRREMQRNRDRQTQTERDRNRDEEIRENM